MGQVTEQLVQHLGLCQSPACSWSHSHCAAAQVTAQRGADSGPEKRAASHSQRPLGAGPPGWLQERADVMSHCLP